jgi:hypothetical protein
MMRGFSGNLGYGCVLHLLSSVVRTVCDGRLAETDANLVKTLEVAIREIWIPLADIVDRLVHPLTLIFFSSCEDPAAIDVTEQLVTRPL